MDPFHTILGRQFFLFQVFPRNFSHFKIQFQIQGLIFGLFFFQWFPKSVMYGSTTYLLIFKQPNVLHDPFLYITGKHLARRYGEAGRAETFFFGILVVVAFLLSIAVLLHLLLVFFYCIMYSTSCRLHQNNMLLACRVIANSIFQNVRYYNHLHMFFSCCCSCCCLCLTMCTVSPLHPPRNLKPQAITDENLGYRFYVL